MDRTVKIALFVVVLLATAIILSVWLFQPPDWGGRL